MFSEFGLPAYLLVERLLYNLLVPFERLSQLLDPIVVDTRLFSQTHKRHAEGRLLDSESFIAVHFETLLAVASDPSGRARILRQDNANLGCLRQNYGSEGE